MNKILRPLFISIFIVFGILGCSQANLKPLAEMYVTKKYDKVSLEITDYSAPNNREFKHLFVSNFSVKLVRGELEYSTARDGMYDLQKIALDGEYGFTKNLVDWNGDGFSDLLMWLSGITYDNQNSLYCAPGQRLSSSNDHLTYKDSRLSGSPEQFLGLRDCEKTYMQLSPLKFDFDSDGIPDYLEIRNGLNPKNNADANTSISADGMVNIDKVKRNIPVDELATSFSNQSYSYEYKTELDANTGVRVFNIDNIPVLKSGQDNLIALYLTEVNSLTKEQVLYSAYLRLSQNNKNKNIKFPFWGNNQSGVLTNQEILTQ